mgnify:CR=1 FL=1
MADRELAKNIAGRIIRAIVVGVITYITAYVIPMMFLQPGFGFMEEYVEIEGPDPRTLLVTFASIAVFFAVAIELTKGTILQHVFSIGRGVAMLFFFIYATSGGVIRMAIDIPEGMAPIPLSIFLTLDISLLLAIIIGIDLLGIAKSVLGAIYFLSEKEEEIS